MPISIDPSLVARRMPGPSVKVPAVQELLRELERIAIECRHGKKLTTVGEGKVRDKLTEAFSNGPSKALGNFAAVPKAIDEWTVSDLTRKRVKKLFQQAAQSYFDHA